jgi:hypothetical protein
MNDRRATEIGKLQQEDRGNSSRHGVSVDERTGHVVLSISDHLDWSDARAHEIILQRKLNTCLAFVGNGGEILKKLP